MNDKWDRRYLGLAKHVSQWSKDPRKKVGAVVTEGKYVRSIGFNGFPTGIADTKARLSDPSIKLQVILHAEVNALAAALGKGDTIYVYPCLPCTQCLSQIIQHNIKRIVSVLNKKSTVTKWNPDLVLSLAKEANLEVNFIDIKES